MGIDCDISLEYVLSIMALKADINNISLMILQKKKRFDELYFT